MAVLDALLGPITGLIDKLIPDPKARQAAKLELIRLQGTQELEQLKAQLSAIVAEAGSPAPAFSMSCTRCCSGRFRWG